MDALDHHAIARGDVERHTVHGVHHGFRPTEPAALYREMLLQVLHGDDGVALVGRRMDEWAGGDPGSGRERDDRLFAEDVDVTDDEGRPVAHVTQTQAVLGG